MASVSRAWISMSVDWPWNPPVGWWMSSRELGRAERRPGSPPARISAPIDIAMPTQIVRTGGPMNCIAS